MKTVLVGTRQIGVEFEYAGMDYDDTPGYPAYSTFGGEVWQYIGTYNDTTKTLTLESPAFANKQQLVETLIEDGFAAQPGSSVMDGVTFAWANADGVTLDQYLVGYGFAATTVQKRRPVTVLSDGLLTVTRVGDNDWVDVFEGQYA